MICLGLLRTYMLFMIIFAACVTSCAHAATESCGHPELCDQEPCRTERCRADPRKVAQGHDDRRGSRDERRGTHRLLAIAAGPRRAGRAARRAAPRKKKTDVPCSYPELASTLPSPRRAACAGCVPATWVRHLRLPTPPPKCWPAIRSSLRAACRRRCAPPLRSADLRAVGPTCGARMLIPSQSLAPPGWRPPSGPGPQVISFASARGDPVLRPLALGTMPPAVGPRPIPVPCSPISTARTSTPGLRRYPHDRRLPVRLGPRPGSPLWTSSLSRPVR